MSIIIERILKGTTGNAELRRMVWNPNARKGEGAYGSPIERMMFQLDVFEAELRRGLHR